MDVANLLDQVQSHAMALGVFDRVNLHQPLSPPSTGVTAAVWVQEVRPVQTVSGLARTSARLEFRLRMYAPLQAEQQDLVDPGLLRAVDVLIAAYSGDFDLGGATMAVDLLGAHGTPLMAEAGYLTQSGVTYRVMTVTLPVIVADAWEQVA